MSLNFSSQITQLNEHHTLICAVVHFWFFSVKAMVQSHAPKYIWDQHITNARNYHVIWDQHITRAGVVTVQTPEGEGEIFIRTTKQK